MKKGIIIPEPKLQIGFSYILEEARSMYLIEALQKTVSDMTISNIDKDISQFVPNKMIATLASKSLRGELLFPVPSVLTANPYLLGYYRLLLGFSQKAFYTKETGLASFKSMEERGYISKNNEPYINELCISLIESLCQLVEGVIIDRINMRLLDDLTLLTLGPQLRGGANVKKGIKGTQDVFEAIKGIVDHTVTDSTSSNITLKNAAGRVVQIQFSSDPDIVIHEEIPGGSKRNIIAIEIKGGTDFSNIHNRLGEAEKSHQKAKSNGYVECWTVVNVKKMNLEIAHKESPTTNDFFQISAIKDTSSSEYTRFKNQILLLTGIADKY